MSFVDGCFNGFGKDSVIPDKEDCNPETRVHNSARKDQPEEFILISYLCSPGGPTRT